MKAPKALILLPTSPRDVVVNLGRSVLWAAWTIKQLEVENISPDEGGKERGRY